MASLIFPANKNIKQVPGFVASMAILDTLPPLPPKKRLSLTD